MAGTDSAHLVMSQDDYRISEQGERIMVSRLMKASNIVDKASCDYAEGSHRRYEISRWNPFFQIVRVFKIWFIYEELKEDDS